MKKNFPQSNLGVIDASSLESSAQAETQPPVELQLAAKTLPLHSSQLSESRCFKLLSDPDWGLPNFCTPIAEQQVFNPTLGDIKTIKLARRLKPLMTMGTIGIMGLAAFLSFSMYRSEAWQYTPAKADELKKEIADLQAINLNHTDYSSLLEDRSRAWSILEFLARLTPADQPIFFNKVEYSIRPNPDGSDIGFTRTWEISGFYDNSAQGALSEISRGSEMRKLFDDIHQVTGDTSFKMIGMDERFIPEPTLTQSRNTRRAGSRESQIFDSPESLDRQFKLTIAQRFGPKDPLSLKNRKN